MPLTPSRMSSGVSTARYPTDFFGNFPKPFLSACNYYENDFNTYAAGDWTVAPATGTSALTASKGGNLTLTSGAVSGNGQGNALNPVSMAFTPGYQTWFVINFLCADNTNPNWVVGLTAGGASSPTSGVYFTKATAVTAVSLVIKGAGTTTISNVTTVTDNVAVALGIYYDGKGIANLYGYSSTGLTGAGQTTPSPTAFGAPPIYGGTRVVAASNDGINVNPLTNLTTNNLQPSFFIQTNAASAKTMVVDYVVAACEIPRF